MAIQSASDSQKVDYLWKKIVYGAAKTDISGNIDATNEPNPSPLLIRGDKIIQQASLIANVIPGSNSSVVTVYPTTLPVECISTAGIPTPTLTWQTGRTFWIPPEFGSTYQIKVYISPSGQAANVLTKGTQVFATGSGNNDLWVFDYQSGILNFNSNNTPYNASNQPISFTGNSVYISGAVYSGQFGLPAATSVGNITFSNTTISTAFLGANIYISPSGNGTVQFGGNLAVGLPYGTDATRPTNAQVGFTRFNTQRDSIEYFDGTNWIIPGEAIITSDIITPDGAANTFPLTSNASTTGVMVSINGTVQQPFTAYEIVNNNQIQFTETPLTTDIVDVRHIAVGAVSIVYDTSALYLYLPTYYGNVGNVNMTDLALAFANTILLQANVTSLQANAYQQQALIGNLQSSAYSNVNVAAYLNNQGYNLYSNVNVAAYLTSYTGAIKGANLNVSGNVVAGTVVGSNVFVNGNVTAQYLFGNGSQLTGIPASYSNVQALSYLITGVGGNVIPSANLIYSLGDPTHQWKDIYVSGNTIYLGGTPLTINNGNLSVGGTPVAANLQTSLPSYSGNIGSLTVTGNLTVTGTTTTVNTEIVNQNEIIVGTLTANVIVSNTSITSANLTTSGNITASGVVSAANVITSGNVTAQYFVGNGSQLSGITSTIATTFETVSRNLNAYPYIINRSNDTISNVVYTVPGSGIITKTFSYSSGLITSIAIYGPAIGPKTFAKNLTYVGTSVSGASYSVL
jgi:hypothetical protein